MCTPTLLPGPWDRSGVSATLCLSVISSSRNLGFEKAVYVHLSEGVTPGQAHSISEKMPPPPRFVPRETSPARLVLLPRSAKGTVSPPKSDVRIGREGAGRAAQHSPAASGGFWSCAGPRLPRSGMGSTLSPLRLSTQTDTSPFSLAPFFFFFPSSVPLPDFQSDYLCQNLAVKGQPMASSSSE